MLVQVRSQQGRWMQLVWDTNFGSVAVYGADEQMPLDMRGKVKCDRLRNLVVWADIHFQLNKVWNEAISFKSVLDDQLAILPAQGLTTH